MSGPALHQVLSLTLMGVPCLLPAALPAAGDTRPAVMIRGAATGDCPGASLARPRLAQPIPGGAATLSRRAILHRSLIFSFPATKDSGLHLARFRGRAGWDGPGTSSSRLIRTQWLSLPSNPRTTAARDLTDLLPQRTRVGRESTGVPESKDATEAKSRMSNRLPPGWYP